MCVEKGLLRPLWCDNDFVQRSHLADLTIDQEVARIPAVTRQTLVGALDDESATAECIRETLKAKGDFLTSADRYWRGEQAFWMSMSGSSIDQLVQAMILGFFPKVGVVKTASEVQREFAQHEDSKMLVFAGPAKSSMYKVVHAHVTSSPASRRPWSASAGLPLPPRSSLA